MRRNSETPQIPSFLEAVPKVVGLVYVGILFLTVITVIGFVLLYIFQSYLPENLNTELIGIFINGVLTTGLLYLYYDSSKTQQNQEESLSEQAKALNSQASILENHTKELATQKEILAEQRDLTKYSQTSIISITDFDFIPLTKSQERHDFQENTYLYYSEFVECEISNYGEAPAHDFTIELYIVADDEEFQFISPLFREGWQETSDKLYSEKATPVLLNMEGAGISSNDEKRAMSATLLSPVEDVPDAWISSDGFGVYKFLGPSGVLEHIADNIDSDIILGTHLWFKDGSGTRGPKFLRWVKVSSDDLIGRSDYMEDDYDMEEDRIDLSQILHEIGRTPRNNEIPDLEHPDDR
jgi:hypothetical protein